MSHHAHSHAEALHAFARLYGYVRYFHPSDAAADLDWECFAVLGARRVLDLKSHDDLQSTLLDLFQPVAPTIQVWREDEPAPQAIARDGAAPRTASFASSRTPSRWTDSSMRCRISERRRRSRSVPV